VKVEKFNEVHEKDVSLILPDAIGEDMADDSVMEIFDVPDDD
jgi:hypothetical protein